MTDNTNLPCVSGGFGANYYNNGNGFDTGLDIVVGGEYSIVVTGQYAIRGGQQPFSPDGFGPPPGITAGELYMSPTADVGAIVGRIGTSGFFFTVGSSVDFIANASGRLYLIVNELNDVNSFESGWSGGVNFTACEITAPPAPTVTPINTSQNNVNITYINGSGPVIALLGSRILIYSDTGTPNNDINVVFNPPVLLTIHSNPFWSAVGQNRFIMVSVENPLGTSTTIMYYPDHAQPLELPAGYAVTKLHVSAGGSGPQYQLDVSLDNYVTNPVNLPTYDPNDALSIQRQQELASEQIAIAINNFALTSQRQGEIASEQIATSLDGVALNLQRQSEILSGNNSTFVGALATGISNSFTDSLTTAVEKILAPIGGAVGIPQQVIDAAIEAIKLLIERELITISNAIKAGTSINALPLFKAITDANKSITDTTKSQTDVFNNLLAGKYKSLDDFYSDLKKSSVNVNLLTTLQNIFTLIFTIATYLKARLGTSEIVLNQLMLSKDTPNLNDINTNIIAYFRGAKTYEDLVLELAKYGLNLDRVNELLITHSLLASLGDVKTAFQRGIIDEPTHDRILAQYGIDKDSVDLLKSVYPLLPSPTDITRMADKHIFAPDIPQIFGQNSEVDDGYIKSMELWGIDEQWTRKLWASHWSLPGLQETFDLWHRGLISDAELDTFFKLTDILPFFREKLKLLSHNLIGRVDIRRFYHVGVYTQQNVYDAYIKLGFSPEDASKQTEFTVENDRLGELPKQVRLRSLTEGLVVKAYKEGILAKQDAINRLAQVGYTASDANLILDIETQTANIAKLADKTQSYHDKAVSLVLKDYSNGVISRQDATNYLVEIGVPQAQAQIELYYSEIERITNLKSLVINHVRSAYSKGQIDKASATNLMLTHGFGMSEIELLFEELDIVVTLRSKELTLAQVTSLAKKGIITPEEFAQELVNLGYNDKHIGWLISETFGV